MSGRKRDGVRRGAFPQWLKKLCDARCGHEPGLVAASMVVRNAARCLARESDKLWIDHVGVLTADESVFISEPYGDSDRDQCLRWNACQHFCKTLGIPVEWSAPGTHHPNTVRFIVKPPRNLDARITLLQADLIRDVEQRALAPLQADGRRHSRANAAHFWVDAARSVVSLSELLGVRNAYLRVARDPECDQENRTEIRRRATELAKHTSRGW